METIDAIQNHRKVCEESGAQVESGEGEFDAVEFDAVEFDGGMKEKAYRGSAKRKNRYNLNEIGVGRIGDLGFDTTQSLPSQFTLHCPALPSGDTQR